MFRLRPFVLAAAFLWAAVAAPRADDWGAVVAVSTTMGINGNRLCVGEGTRGDIGCPTYAPSLTTAGGISVTGNVSAAKFIGDGSELVGVVAVSARFASLTDISVSYATDNIFVGNSGGGLNTGISNTAFGNYALSANTSGYKNAAFGARALKNNTTGYFNSAFGTVALYQNTTGSNNTAVGEYAMGANTSGFQNTGLGAGALSNNSTGSYNTATGFSALNSLSSGNFNVAIGFNAAGNNIGSIISASVIVGANAGESLSTASDNVFVGTSAGKLSTTGSYNTLLGRSAGGIVTTGSSNTLVGWNAGGAITTGNNNIVIGTNLSPYSNTGSNQLNLGNAVFGDLGRASNLQAKLGINVTSPTTSLDVSGTIKMTDGGESCTANREGAIKYASGEFYLCRNGTAWESLTSIAAGAITVSDRIVSTSANIVAGNGGTISFTTGGVSGTAYLDTAGRFVNAGISTTGPISTSVLRAETLRMADNPGEGCTAESKGTIKVVDGKIFICRYP